MKVQQFMENNNLKDEEDLRLFLRQNLMEGKLPVAIVSCIKCDEIIEDYGNKGCPYCGDDNMKIKSDFVTNSSSTSYILIGFKMDWEDLESIVENGLKIFEEDIKDMRNLKEIINENKLSFMNGIDDGLNSKDEILIGKSFDVDEYTYAEIDYNKIFNEIKIISDLFDISKEDIKIFTTARMS